MFKHVSEKTRVLSCYFLNRVLIKALGFVFRDYRENWNTPVWLLHWYFVPPREFELSFLNGSWEDVPECQKITQNECDLTVDLSSDSDYNVRVRAECNNRVSPWSELHKPFNRRHSKELWDMSPFEDTDTNWLKQQPVYLVIYSIDLWIIWELL